MIYVDRRAILRHISNKHAFTRLLKYKCERAIAMMKRGKEIATTYDNVVVSHMYYQDGKYLETFVIKPLPDIEKANQ